MKEEKEALVEEMGMHFENLFYMSPLAARIYASLLLSGCEGATFEDVLECTQASKSSVSTSINLLLQTQRIEYFTKVGDRKRYFRKASAHLKNRLENYLILLEKEIELLTKGMAFNEKYNPESFQKNATNTFIYKDHLITTRKNVRETLQKFNSSAQSTL